MNIGIDVGSTHIGIGIVDNDGEIIFKNEKDYCKKEKDMSQVVMDTIKELINDFISKGKIKKENITKIGIAFPRNCI